MMSEVYPFTMNWENYTDDELIKEAFTPLNGLDRADVVALSQELARRYEWTVRNLIETA